MTAEDVIAGAKGKPQPFECLGFTYHLRPITRLELRELNAAREGVDGAALQAKVVALAVCDEAGKPLLTEEQVPLLPNAAIDALSDEIAKRNWMPPEGKGDSAKTPA